MEWEEAERERRRKEREEREKEWVKKAANNDTTRNRRVFGVLLGTLQRFRKDQTAVADKVRQFVRLFLASPWWLNKRWWAGARSRANNQASGRKSEGRVR